ncbi:MAG: hypothetical protein AB7S68_40020 [Polyangiaceae bacterium]
MKPGTSQVAHSWSPQNPVIVVEMGFGGGSNKSCGVLRKSAGLNPTTSSAETFGSAQLTVAGWLRETESPVALIIEAPLSFF